MRRRDLLCAIPPCLLPGLAGAQDFPARPVQIVVPFPPGGGTDVLIRLLTPHLQRQLGQPVVVDNRPGATGSIGNDRVAKAAPDGHTLLAQATIISVFPQMMQGLTYDPLRDLAAVGMVGETPTVFVTHPASPFTTLPDLAPASRQRPLNFGTAGVGSPQHLGTMGMARQLGIAVEHVPYRGTAPAVTDVLGRQLDFAAFSLSSVLPLIQEGKLKALAVHAPQRVRFAPEISSAAEQGVRDAGSSVRFLLLAPGQTPPAVIARLNAVLNEAIRSPEIADAFAARGYTATISTPEEAQAAMVREERAWAPLIRDLGVRITE
jgi:tripartite-type tricarboxylate transporter receptor subunit TctC